MNERIVYCNHSPAFISNKVEALEKSMFESIYDFRNSLCVANGDRIETNNAECEILLGKNLDSKQQ